MRKMRGTAFPSEYGLPASLGPGFCSSGQILERNTDHEFDHLLRRPWDRLQILTAAQTHLLRCSLGQRPLRASSRVRASHLHLWRSPSFVACPTVSSVTLALRTCSRAINLRAGGPAKEAKAMLGISLLGAFFLSAGHFSKRPGGERKPRCKISEPPPRSGSSALDSRTMPSPEPRRSRPSIRVWRADSPPWWRARQTGPANRCAPPGC